MSAVPDAYITTAIAAADAARVVAMKYFRSAPAIDSKADHSPVTEADRAAERTLRELILTRHPQHGFCGEESGVAGAADAEWRWVIDPIDGTKSFATGGPTFGTLIALLHQERPLLGVIDHAALQRRLIGVRGRRTLDNAAECATSATTRLADATLYSTSPDMFDATTRAGFERLSAAVRFRVFGGDCHCYSLLAAGHTDAVCEAGMKPHDYLALLPVVEGAGGVITDWHGNPPRATASGDTAILASANRELHRAALALLA